MKRIFCLTFIGLITLGCTAQETEKNQKLLSDRDTVETPQPEVSWEVHKETDEHGNVIRYDSTYTWTYQSKDGDVTKLDVDSVMRSFQNYFDLHLPGNWDNDFDHPLRRDSTFYQDFFRDDYFYQQWQRSQQEMQYMFKRMDSLRNEFFQQRYPDMMPGQQHEDDGERI